MSPTFERKIAVLFTAGVIILASIGAAAWWSLSRFEDGFGRVDRTRQVLNVLEDILVQALNIQAGSRGYALSGDERFLEPFEEGVQEIYDRVNAVRDLTRHHPQQQASLGELRIEVQRLIRLMQQRNEALRLNQIEAARDTALLYAGREAMERVRAIVEEMRATEELQLLTRSEALRTEAARIRGILLLAVALTLLFAGAAGTRIHRDLAARRRADEALRRSRAVFETLFEQATDALVVVDKQGLIRRVNRRTEDLFGYARAELLGQPIETLLPERFHDAHRRHRAGYHAAPKFRAMGAGLELFARRKDGEQFAVDIMLSPLETEEGRVVLAAVRDITERRAAALALQRSADEIRDLYNLAPCGYHSLNADAVFVAVNDTELRWLGYTREEVIGKMKFSDLLTDEGRAKFQRTFPQFRRAGQIDAVEFELRRKDGSTFFVSLSATATYDADGNYLASRSTVHDITARREAEQHLGRLHAALQHHSRELEAANEQLEAFNSSVSHDLRAPLRHLTGFATILREQAGPKLDEEGRRYLDVITRSAEKMGKLIDDLLGFARMGRAPLRVETVDMDALVRDLLRDGVIDAAPGTEWHVDPLPRVEGDPALLQQVWINLLGNAAKYSSRSQPPRIEVTTQSLPAENEIEFRVRDNGVGFDPQHAAKLFGVFTRLHTDREFAGTGVGLALVKRIVTRHGGRVDAHAEPGCGAMFRFTLPARAVARERS